MLFKFKKGKHKPSKIVFGLHTGTDIEVATVRFDRDCWYKPIDWENDYNKLFGWTYGLFPRLVRVKHGQPIWFSWYNKLFRRFNIPYMLVASHHYNSVRVGWRPHVEYKDVIELNLYVYEKGFLRVVNTGLLVPTKTPMEVTIVNDFPNNQVILDTDINNTVVTLPFNAKPKWGYILHPYFGGNNAAPHDMSLILNIK